MFRRIPCDWFLSDGILPAVRLETPETVADALRHAGLLEAHSSALETLKDEWIYRRKWRYFTQFSAEASSRRRYLSVTRLEGDWTLTMNGTMLMKSNAPLIEVEVSDVIQEGDNALEICFDAPDCEKISPKIGFGGAISLRETDGLVLCRLQLNGTPDEGYTLSADVEAQEEGECLLDCALRYGAENRQCTLSAHLSRGRQTVLMAPFEANDWPRGTRAAVSVKILQDDNVSDEALLSVYLPEETIVPRGFQEGSEFAAAACARAGGNALYSGPEAGVFAAEHGLVLLSQCALVQSARMSMAREEQVLALAGGDWEALNEGAVWRLTGSSPKAAPADLGETARRYGADLSDWSEVCRVTRYHQAAGLRRRAEDARLNGEPFMLLDVCDKNPRCASSALFDADGRPRPAYQALADAWRRDHAFVRAPQSFPEDGIVNIPIYYVYDGKTAGATINAIALRSDGQELVSATFPAAGRTEGLVGRLCTEMPEDGCVLLRTRVIKNGQCVGVSDDVVYVRPENLLKLPKTQLLWDGDKLQNVGSSAAIGVSVPGAGYFGTLLPGETVTLSDLTARYAEGLNTYE